jgi:hypothetical protein
MPVGPSILFYLLSELAPSCSRILAPSRSECSEGLQKGKTVEREILPFVFLTTNLPRYVIQTNNKTNKLQEIFKIEQLQRERATYYLLLSCVLN